MRETGHNLLALLNPSFDKSKQIMIPNASQLNFSTKKKTRIERALWRESLTFSSSLWCTCNKWQFAQDCAGISIQPCNGLPIYFYLYMYPAILWKTALLYIFKHPSLKKKQLTRGNDLHVIIFSNET